MKWYKQLYQFWMANLERNVKRISIGFGSFLIVVITTCTTPFFLPALYGATISFGSMVIMSIFGKNGNGHTIEPEPEPEPEGELAVLPEPEPIKEKITIP